MKVGCGLALAVIACASLVGAVGSWYAWKEIEATAEDFGERKPELMAKGAAIAQGGADACVETGLKQGSVCARFEIGCRVEAGLIAGMCLEAAKPPPAFCAPVPPRSDIVDVSLWAVGECEKRGMVDDQPCAQFFNRAVAGFCDKERAKK